MSIPQRIVVKIGSSSLTASQGGLLRTALDFYVEEIVYCRQHGIDVVLVTSGAVAAGYASLGLATRPQTMHEKQASAAVGQAFLMQAYNESLQRHQLIGAQLLLNRGDFSDRKRMQHAQATLDALLQRRVLPIINENDTTSIAELTFGDNDRLSALVANLIKAHGLLMITDMDGLYTADPRKDADAQKIEHVSHIDAALWHMAGGTGSDVGTGGMRSKLAAARIAMQGGVRVFVGKVCASGSLLRTVAGHGEGTYFDPTDHTLSIKKQWIGFHSFPQGRIVVDDGAIHALMSGGKSLLPAGVLSVVEEFHPGDIVEVSDTQGKVIGRGIVNYAAWQLRAVARLSTAEVAQRIDVSRVEVIHRDDWVTHEAF